MAKKNKQSTKSKKAKNLQNSSKVLPVVAPLIELPLEKYFTQIKWVLLALGIVYLLYVSWGLLSPYTWDDDCPNRYYNALKAWSQPSHLVSMWNRPLWIWLFMIPVKLGTFSVPILMSFLSVVTGYYCYKIAQKLDLTYPLMAAVFLLLQPYFMGVGRDAMTEPLAACIIAGGIYYFLERRYLLFALIGSLLPLARAELVILLGLWALALVVKKQWKFIPLLGIGVVIWSVLALIIKGDFFYILNETIFKEAGENRYGNSEFGTYLSRYFYVIGPVVFYYFIIGLLTSIKEKKVDLLILIQFLLGFGIYTLFAWKINLGHSAAFLRNLIPLSPLVAIIALVGLDGLVRNIRSGKNKVFSILSVIVPMLLTAVFYRNKMVSHHRISEEFDPYNLPIILGLGLLTLLVLLLPRLQSNPKFGILGLIIVSPILLASHTMITEPPSKNSTAERISIKRTADIIRSTSKMSAPLYCNHTFFYWAAGADKTNEQYHVLTNRNLKDAPIGSIVVWESHYSNRLEGDVQINTLINDTENYLQLYRVVDSKNSFQAYVFEKIAPSSEPLKILNDFIAEIPGVSEPIVTRGVLYTKQNRVRDAIEEFDFAASVDQTNALAYFEKGNLYLRIGNQEEALKNFDLALGRNNRLLNAQLSKSAVFYMQGRYKESIEINDFCIDQNQGFSAAYYYKGLNLIMLNDKKNGCLELQKAKQLGFVQANEAIEEHCR